MIATVHKFRGPGIDCERGMVTAEFAVGILAAAFILAMLSWVVGVVATQIQCQESAAQIARQIARGDDAAAQRARTAVPASGQVDVTRAGQDITVTVHADMHWGKLGPVPVSGKATLTAEPGVG